MQFNFNDICSYQLFMHYGIKYTVPVIFFFNQKVQDTLKDAWNAEGSPFKGQSFDPSKINMGQGGVVTINNQEDPMAK